MRALLTYLLCLLLLALSASASAQDLPVIEEVPEEVIVETFDLQKRSAPNWWDSAAATDPLTDPKAKVEWVDSWGLDGKFATVIYNHSQGMLMGLIDTTGRYRIPLAPHGLFPYHTGVVVRDLTGSGLTARFYDLSLREVWSSRTHEVQQPGDGVLAITERGTGKTSVVDWAGNTILAPMNITLNFSSSGLWTFRDRQSKRMGLLNERGQLILPAHYEAITNNHTVPPSLTTVDTLLRQTIIGETGRVIIDGDYDRILAKKVTTNETYEYGYFLAYRRGQYQMFNAKGQPLLSETSTDIRPAETVAFVLRGQTYAVYSTRTGEQLTKLRLQRVRAGLVPKKIHDVVSYLGQRKRPVVGYGVGTDDGIYLVLRDGTVESVAEYLAALGVR